MKRFLLLILLVAVPLSAASNVPNAYPDDFKPSPCAPDADAVCESFSRLRFAGYASTFRTYDIHESWLDAHWEEMRQAYRPICAKIANCFTIPVNGWIYCIDEAQSDFFDACSRFPEGSTDRDQCSMFAMVYWIGLGAKSKLHAEAQSCVASQPPAPEGTLDVFMDPPRLSLDRDARITIWALDADRRLPVHAEVHVETGEQVSTEGPVPITGYPFRYSPRLKRVPRPDGRHDEIVTPKITVTAPGYKTVVFDAPLPVPKMTFEMTPSVKKLRRGPNAVTITAKDADTGEPVYARVMGGNDVLGETNKPFILEVKRGQKLPEIWLKSLHDRYSDAVVVEGE
jgi:hypothetical protein